MTRSGVLLGGLLALTIVGCSGSGATRGDGGTTRRDSGEPPLGGDAGADAGSLEGADAGGELTDAALPMRDAEPARRDAGSMAVSLPEPNVAFDYQLGGPYAPPAGVGVVSRDRTAPPAPGLYNVCYINGFQTQPGERDTWESEHPELLLRDARGRLVIDPEWPDEIMLDISTPERRAALAEVVGAWIDQCARDGFDAIEIDNLDTYSRSGGLLTMDQAVAYMRMLSDRAHASGLASAQKNSAEILSRRAEMATDFAVVEQCSEYDECADFVDAYGDHLLIIEYDRAAFDRACRDFPDLSIVFRDVDLVTPGDRGYVRDDC